MFADIAGFTPLTEALDRALGARRGVEEMTRQINRVYDALIGEVERYGGSVVGFAADDLAGLARIALSQGDPAEALTHIEQILAHLGAGGAVEGLSIYLTCYHVLRAAGDPRATAILETAYTMVRGRAARISDEANRRSYLENVPHHRAIAAAWAEAQGSE